MKVFRPAAMPCTMLCLNNQHVEGVSPRIGGL